jgi:hypothetical protein
MSDQITTALVKGFRANFTLLAQQKKSRLRMAVREEPLTGEDDFFDRVGAADGADITSRHGDTQYASTPHDRRKVYAIGWEWADLIDKPDKVRMLGDPQSTYVQAAVASAGRRIDDHIIAAFFGTAYSGKTGTTAITFPTGATNVVPVNLSGSNEGLTVNKLIRAKRLLWEYDVDEDIPLHIAVTGEQLEDLLKTTQVTSADYNSVKALVKGEIDTFMGMTFHRSQRLLTDTSSYRRVPVWAEDGVLLGIHTDVKVYIDVLPQKRHSTQVRVELDMGATRMEESKVVEIKCLEA